MSNCLVKVPMAATATTESSYEQEYYGDRTIGSHMKLRYFYGGIIDKIVLVFKG